MEKRKEIIVLVILILLFFTINYSFLDKSLENFLTEQKIVKIARVIDGDTVVTSSNEHIRLLGMNAPETTKKERYSQEAKIFLNNLVLNKKVKLKYGKDKKDRYKRTLAYLFLNQKNVNLELVKQGLANFYFPSGKTKEYDIFKEAWENCINENKNLCEKSKDICSDCIKLNKFDVKNQEVIFYNKCDFDCDLTNWDIKDEGRKHFFFPKFVLKSKEQVRIKVGKGTNSNGEFFWEGYPYIWTKSGDTLFLRDKKGGLVLWKNY